MRRRLDRGAKIDAKGNDCATAQSLAEKQGKTEVVALLKDWDAR